MATKLATRSLSSLLALALALTMCPAASLAYAAEGDASGAGESAVADGSASGASGDVADGASGGDSGEASGGASGGHISEDAVLDTSGSSGSSGESASDDADDGSVAGTAAGSASSDASSRYTGASNGQTSADVSLSGAATVGTIEYNGLAYTINEDDDSTVSVTGLASAKPAGDVQIPAQIASGGELYAVSAIKVPGLADDANPYAEELFDDDAKALAVKSVSIPQSVASIDTAFFQLFPNTTDITVSTENGTYTSYDGALYDADLTQLILVPQGKGSLVLPQPLASVPAYVFSQCDKLSAITFSGSTGNEFLAVQNNCLYTNDLSTLLAVPAGLGASASIASECTTIAEGAFFGNAALDTIVVNGVVEGIASAGDSALDANGQPLIGGSAVDGSTLPAFDGATVANATVVINVSAEADGDEASALIERAKAAWEAYGFTKFKEPATPGTEIVPDQGSGFAFTLLPDYTLSVRWAGSTEPPAAIDIPDYGIIDGVQYTVSAIAQDGFSDYTSLITVDIPQTVTTIGDSAFELCTSLQTVHFDSVVSIGAKAFANTALLSLVLPTTVQSIGDNAFSNTKETTIVALGSIADNSPIALGAAAGLSVYVPYGTEGTWDAGIPTLGNHIYPYGVKLSDEPLELEVGQTANIKDNGYIEAPGAIEATYAYKANPVSINADDGTIEAKAAGSTYINVSLQLTIDQVAVKSNVSNVMKLQPVAANSEEESDIVSVPQTISLAADTMNAVMLAAADEPAAQADVNSNTDYMEPTSINAAAKTCYVKAKDGYQESIKGALLIPETLQGYTVVGIAAKGFIGCTNIVSLSLPSTVKVIGGGLSSGAFQNCINLKGVNLPEGLETIDTYAFINTALGSVYIPSTVKNIGIAPFAMCSNLIAINVDGDNAHFYSIDGVLYGKSEGENDVRLISYPTNSSVSVFSIPSGVNVIDNYALAGSVYLTEVSIPSTMLTANGFGACIFQSCSALRSVYVYCEANLNYGSGGLFNGVPADQVNVYVLNQAEKTKWEDPRNNRNPDCVIIMPDYSAYLEATNKDEAAKTCLVQATSDSMGKLEGILIIPEKIDGYTVVGIAFQGFYNHTEIVSVSLPSTIESLGQNAFHSCSSLSTVVLPENIKEIETYAFCMTALGSVYIPASVEVLGTNPFLSCSNLIEIAVSPENPYFYSIGGALFGADKGSGDTRFISYPCRKEEKTFSIPDCVTAIDHYVFRTNPHIESVSIPSSIRSDGLGACLFQGCSALKTVYAYSTANVNHQSGGIFSSLPSDQVTIYVMNEDQKAQWEDARSGRSPDHVIIMTDHTSYLEAVDKDEANKTCYIKAKDSFKDAITGALVIPEVFDGYRVIGIAEKGFMLCSGITSVSLPSSIRVIGGGIAAGSFQSCSNLATINIPEGVETIGTYAFASTSLGNLYIPSTVKTIGIGIAIRCSSLIEVSVSSSNSNFYTIDGVLFGTNEGASDFRLIVYPGSKSNKSYTIPDGVEVLDHYTFTGNPYIESVTIPESVKDPTDRMGQSQGIGASSFSGCVSLKEVICYSHANVYQDGQFSSNNKATLYCWSADKSKWEGRGPSSIVCLDQAQIIVLFKANTTDIVEGMPDDIISNSNVTLSRPADPYRIGYDFAGWYEKAYPTAADKPFDFAAGANVTDALILYAKWVPVAYDLTLDTNGIDAASGLTMSDDASVITGGNNPTTYTIESTVVIANPARVGYTFAGWVILNDVETGSITSENNGLNLTINRGSMGAVSLQAKWSINTYTISYSSNGATKGSAPDPTTLSFKVTDSGKSLPSATWAKLGYHFGGWATDTTGSGPLAAGPIDSLHNLVSAISWSGNSTAKAATLYVRWQENTYDISFDAGALDGDDAVIGGSPPASQGGKGYTEKISFPAVGFTQLGYTFTKWDVKAGTAGADSAGQWAATGSAAASVTVKEIVARASASGQAVSDDASGNKIVLYANWGANRYTLQYAKGDVTDAVELPTSGFSGITYTQALGRKIEGRLGNTLGFISEGWTGSGTREIDEPIADSVTLTKDSFSTYFNGYLPSLQTLTLTASWTAKRFTVEYNKNSDDASYITTSGSAGVPGASDPIPYTDASYRLPADVDGDGAGKAAAGIAYEGYNLDGWRVSPNGAQISASAAVADIVSAAYAAADDATKEAMVDAGDQRVVVYAVYGQGSTGYTLIYSYQSIEDGTYPDALKVTGKSSTSVATGSTLVIEDVMDARHSHAIDGVSYTYVPEPEGSDTGEKTISGTSAENVWTVRYKLVLTVNYASADTSKGSVAEASREFNWGDRLTVPDTSSSSIHQWRFAGWSPSAGAPAVSDGAVVGQDHAVYAAEWDDVIYTVSFDCYEGTENAMVSSFPALAEGGRYTWAQLDGFTIGSPVAAEGYIFKDWKDKPAGTSASYDADASIRDVLFGSGSADGSDMSGALYANMAAKTYTVRLWALADMAEGSQMTDANGDPIELKVSYGGDDALMPRHSDIGDACKLYGYLVSGFVQDSFFAAMSPEAGDGVTVSAKDLVAVLGDIDDGGVYDLFAKWNAVYRVSVPTSEVMLSIDTAKREIAADRQASVQNASPKEVYIGACSEVGESDKERAKMLFFNDGAADDSLLKSVQFSFLGQQFSMHGSNASGERAEYASPIAGASSADAMSGMSGALSLELSDDGWARLMQSMASASTKSDAELAALGLAREGQTIKWGRIATITWLVSSSAIGDYSWGEGGTGAVEYGPFDSEGDAYR